VKEDRIRIPIADMYDPQVRARLNLNDCFEERTCPVSVVGVGKASLVTKTLKAANIYLMESASAVMFHGKRAELIGGTSDQGTEKGMGEDTVFALSQFAGLYASGSKHAFMYPNVLWVTGMMHILYNGLEEAVTSLPGYEDFIEKLRVLERFLSDGPLRRRFQATCLEGKACCFVFDHHPRVHIDWKWEFLLNALDGLDGKLQHLVDYFNADAILGGDSGSIRRFFGSRGAKYIEGRSVSGLVRVLEGSLQDYSQHSWQT
jgi:hypothetical protein